MSLLDNLLGVRQAAGIGALQNLGHVSGQQSPTGMTHPGRAGNPSVASIPHAHPGKAAAPADAHGGPSTKGMMGLGGAGAAVRQITTPTWSTETVVLPSQPARTATGGRTGTGRGAVAPVARALPVPAKVKRRRKQ